MISSEKQREMGNMLKKFVLGALLSTALASQAPADCLLEQAMHNMEYGYIQLKGEHATKMAPILDEMKKIPGGGNNDLPSGLQMSPQASQRFQKLSFDLLKIRSQVMILSAYVRDARVITKAAQIAENMRKGKSYDEKDPDFFYSAIVAILSGVMADELNPQPSADDCSVDSGLRLSESLTLKDVDGTKMKEAWDRVLAPARQYKIDTRQQGWFGRLNQIPLLPIRKQALADLQVVQSGQKDLEFIKAIEALRALNRISMTIYSTHRADINTSTTTQADFDKRFGSTWEAQLKASDDRTKQLEQVIRVIQERVPSDSAIENQQIADEMKKRGLQ